MRHPRIETTSRLFITICPAEYQLYLILLAVLIPTLAYGIIWSERCRRLKRMVCTRKEEVAVVTSRWNFCVVLSTESPSHASSQILWPNIHPDFEREHHVRSVVKLLGLLLKACPDESDPSFDLGLRSAFSSTTPPRLEKTFYYS